jgi:MoxR-like ATPase
MTYAHIEDLQEALAQRNYIADRSLTTALFLAMKLNKPLLLEGEAGVGKTEVAKTLAAMLGTELIRLQCYEGLDASTAIYEWNYPRQLLHIRMAEATQHATATDIFSREFLIQRPLLHAIDGGHSQAPVLLIDELDRADEEFEAFLLELLSDWQITIPELGTIKALHPPIVIITSNRTREVHDALKRRCLFHWVDYPILDKELKILHARVPGVNAILGRQIVLFVQELRRLDLFKVPGVAETIDWANALAALQTTALTFESVDDTLGAILKYQDDLQQIRGDAVRAILARIGSA